MIKATDLRIGNWVNDPLAKGYNNPGPVQVESININGINEWQDMGASGLITFEEMEPIPFIPEWLERCAIGFFEADRATESLINLIYKGTVIATFKRDSLPPCKFVHQLQNLIQSLTGTELEIKLP